MKLQLRPRQAAVVSNVGAAFREGHKRVMVYAPCGFGKTEIATALLQATYNNGKAGAFMADRISLVNQTSARFDKYELPHGIMQAQNERYAPSERIQVCSMQTLLRRRRPDGQLVVIDEAHDLSERLREWLLSRDRYYVGLSATPLTPGLARYFDTVVKACTTNELIAEGSLVPPVVFSFEAPNMDGVLAGPGGEWNDKQAEQRVLQVVGDVVTTYLQHGQNKKFVAFAWNIAHAQELQRQFLAAGVNVATYTAADTPDDRTESVKEFEKPGEQSSIRGLISVEALTRGFDVTDVEILIDCHPIRKAWWVYVQMLGRVMRGHPGKTRALVFDHSGNCTFFWSLWQNLFEHGVDELDDGTRTKSEKKGEEQEPEPMKCSKCGHLHRPMPVCPNCGHEYPKRGAIEHVPGTLKEIVASGSRELLKTTIWPQVCWIVANQRKPRDGAHANSMARAMYHELTGLPAPGHFAATTPIEAQPDVLGKVKANAIRFHQGKKAQKRKEAARAV